jgi:hypothetical protein
MKIVRVNKDGSMNDLDLKLKKNTILKQLNKFSISKGNNDLCELYKWIYEDKNIICYGCYDGDAGFENKHDLIPNGNSSFLEENSSEKLLFGDLFLVCYEKNKIIDYCVSDYAEFYSIVFDGFDDCSENDLTDDETEGTDIEEDDDCNSIKTFIINDNDNESTDESYEYIDDEELDEDSNGY